MKNTLYPRRKDWSGEITSVPAAQSAANAEPAGHAGAVSGESMAVPAGKRVIRPDGTPTRWDSVSGRGGRNGAAGGAENPRPSYNPGPMESSPAPDAPEWSGWNGDSIGPEIENNLPADVVEAPTTMAEVYRGSMKAMLMRNIGNYVVATFLIGTQSTVSWEGVLYDVGNDYVAIYQTGRDQYIVSDLYSLKYVEFYDTRRRALCDELLEERGGGSYG